MFRSTPNKGAIRTHDSAILVKLRAGAALGDRKLELAAITDRLLVALAFAPVAYWGSRFVFRDG